MKNWLLLLVLAAPAWAGDVYIVSPLEKETVSGMVTLQVQSPVGNPSSINASMILNVYNGPDKVVWRGKLNQADNYTTQIDTTGFTPGQYDISVSYFFKEQKIDKDIGVFVK